MPNKESEESRIVSVRLPNTLVQRLDRLLSTWLKIIRYFGSSFVALIKLYPLYIGTHNTKKLSLRHLPIRPVSVAWV